MNAADKLVVVELLQEFFEHIRGSDPDKWFSEKKKRLAIEDSLEGED